jgi:hypothetical protein
MVWAIWLPSKTLMVVGAQPNRPSPASSPMA